jgi:AraC-like DNA-binding protein/quercetin dioxygenase-like cupin family protein
MKDESTNMYLDWPARKEEQVSVMRWTGDEVVSAHKHDFIEIAFLEQGSCEHLYQNRKVRLIPGDILIIAPHEEHAYDISAKTIITNCLFYPGALGEDWNNIQNITEIVNLLVVEPFYRQEPGCPELLHLAPEEADSIRSVLNAMLDERKNKLMGSELMLKAYLTAFLCILGRAWKKQFSADRCFYSVRRSMLAEAMAYMEQNIAEPMITENLASKVFMSPNYFRRVFKSTTGLTPLEYINNLRISNAMKLLESGTLSITEVGESVGIGDSNYFSRLFKVKAGLSPNEYRKKFKSC